MNYKVYVIDSDTYYHGKAFVVAESADEANKFIDDFCHNDLHNVIQKQVRTQACEYLDKMKARMVAMLGDHKYLAADTFKYFMDLLIREIYKAGEKTDESKN